MQRLRSQECQLLCVLADSRNAGGSAPVVVKMSHFVRQNFDFVLVETTSIVDDVVCGWRNGSLSNMLRDQEEATRN
jgi:hypothetical protein